MDYLYDILDALRKSREFVAGMSMREFSEDDKTAYAVVRALEVIGDASKRIPGDLRERHPRPLERDGRDARQADPS